jgi:CRP-like cAMP-binding protein
MGLKDLAEDQRRRVLAKVPLLGSLEGPEIDRLVALGQPVRVDRRQDIVRAGEKGDRLFLLLQGRAEVIRTSSDGAQAIVDLLGSGEVLGEIALLAGGVRTATVTAIEPCELLVFHQKDVLALLERHPAVAIQLLGVLASRLYHTTEIIADTLFLRLAARLAKRILGLAREYGERTDEGSRIDFKISQRELGAMVGTSRESINKQIRAWTRAGILTVHRGFITIRQPERLEALARALIS